MYTQHGGDWAGYQWEFGRPALDFSANLSPLGMPPALKKAVRQSLALSEAYPDPLCRALTEALARSEGVPPGWVLCGGGAAELIFRLALSFRPTAALVTAPTFGEYEAALTALSCPVRHYPLQKERGFLLDEGFLEAVRPGMLVFLCEPNNPTGLLTPRPLVLKVLEQCRRRGAFLVADECFYDFLDDPASHTLRPELGEGGLLILRSFTKMYAMAGLRLGYCLCADGALLQKMRGAGQPWAVSTPAQAAGLAALQLTDWPARVRRLIKRERAFLSGQLRGRGYQVFGGQANYLLFYSYFAALAEDLKPRGVLIRDCSAYPGLGPGYFRVAVLARRENQALLAALDGAVG